MPSPKRRCLDLFLNYYNAQQLRNFRYSQRLAGEDENHELPDFLCSDGEDCLLVDVRGIQDDPTAGALPPVYIQELFLPLLSEASRKFTNASSQYPDSMSVLLIENQHLLIDENDRDDRNDIVKEIRVLKANIDQVYLMSTDKGNVVRLL